MSTLSNFGNMDYSKAFTMHNLTPKVRAHLSHVYRAVAGTMVVAAAGVYLHLHYHVGSLFFVFAAIASAIAIEVMPNVPHNVSSRFLALAFFGLFQGLSLGPLVEQVMDIDGSIVLFSLVSSVAVFACFSLAAIYAERRSYLYLGSILGSALSVMLLAGFVNIFLQSEAIFNIQLYGGLLMFLGYVVFDTQMIIEKASLGVMDVPRHSLELFVDLVAIFVRIMIILSKLSGKKKNTSRR